MALYNKSLKFFEKVEYKVAFIALKEEKYKAIKTPPIAAIALKKVIYSELLIKFNVKFTLSGFK